MRMGLAIGVSAAVAFTTALPARAAAAKPGTTGVIEGEYERASQGERKKGGSPWSS